MPYLINIRTLEKKEKYYIHSRMNKIVFFVEGQYFKLLFLNNLFTNLKMLEYFFNTMLGFIGNQGVDEIGGDDG